MSSKKSSRSASGSKANRETRKRRFDFFRLELKERRPTPLDLLWTKGAPSPKPKLDLDLLGQRLHSLVCPDWTDSGTNSQLFRPEDSDVEAYFLLPGGTTLLGNQNSGLAICFARLRDPRNLPVQLEQNGRTTAVEVAKNARLAEMAHAVLFPGGILGFESNNFVGRAQRLADAILAKASDSLGSPAEIIACPLLDQKVLTQLGGLTRARRIGIRLNREDIDRQPTGTSEFAELQRKAGPDLESISVELGFRKDATDKLWAQNLSRWASTLYEHFWGSGAAPTRGSKLRVYGAFGENHAESVADLLDARIFHEAEVEVDAISKRALLSISAFQAIRAGYDAKRQQIEHACAVSAAGDDYDSRPPGSK